jgi:hypothetical protein
MADAFQLLALLSFKFGLILHLWYEVYPVAGILVDLGHPQSRSSKSILTWGTMSVPTFQTFFGTALEGVIENQCCQLV